jgi:branched-chain amino acid transport system ATP-binding protein
MLDVTGLVTGYGRKDVVVDATFSVGDGEFVAVLGANGAGKSSTLRCLLGVLPQRGGVVRFRGDDVSTWPAGRRVRGGLTLVPEGRQLFPGMTVRENLDLAYEASHGAGRPAGNRSALLEKVFGLFPRLVERERQPAGTLSGGEQQMVALGRGLLAEPTLLLLDEPSLGLAPAVVDQVMDVLQELNREGLSILMVEQDAYRALALCDRAYVLDRGRVVLSGNAAALREDPAVQDAFLGRLETP